MNQILMMLLAGCISYSVICRLRHTDHETPTLIKWQHCLLNAGALYSVVLPIEWSGVSMGAGIVAFLLLGAPRWRHGVPGGTVRG